MPKVNHKRRQAMVGQSWMLGKHVDIYVVPCADGFGWHITDDHGRDEISPLRWKSQTQAAKALYNRMYPRGSDE